VVPIEVLLVPAVLTRRRHWFRTGLWISLGSALGAASVAWLAARYGIRFVDKLFHGATHDPAWVKAQSYISAHGWWGLALVSLSPLPQHPAVAIAGLARMKATVVFVSVFAGRLIKYEVLAWATAWLPRLLHREPHAGIEG
jgi:membrane protein YqaA with SNARE-associated domain